MSKKILFALATVLVVAGGVAALSAYEAHVINVTAHIENALYVHPDEIAFGTVFPQEWVYSDFTVELSDSFLAEERVWDVLYKIVQKPKCECIFDPVKEPMDFDLYCEGEKYARIDYSTYECPEYYEEMENLCPFLSKLDGDPEDLNDYEVLSYYDMPGCQPAELDATGMLHKFDGILSDEVDLWIVDLKVPPVEGYVGQDWPSDCPTVPTNDVDYGCDLWIEVTEISEPPA